MLWVCVQVLAFCEALADAADLRQHLHLNTRVVRIDPVLPQQQQQVQQSATAANGNAHSAVAVGAGSAAVEAAAAAGAALQGASATSSSLWQQPGLKWRVLTAAAAAANGSAQDGCQADGQQEQQEQREWLFDAVASCTGTFSEIRLPQVCFVVWGVCWGEAEQLARLLKPKSVVTTACCHSCPHDCVVTGAAAAVLVVTHPAGSWHVQLAGAAAACTQLQGGSGIQGPKGDCGGRIILRCVLKASWVSWSVVI